MSSLLWSGTTHKALHILPHALALGTTHILELTVWTPFSTNTTISEEFLVNKPPYGGNCNVDPTEGKSAEDIIWLTQYMLIEIGS